jgi:hypothetical protein
MSEPAELVPLPSRYVPPSKPPRPPRGLGSAGRRLWRGIVAGYELDADDLALLSEACAVSDRIAAMEGELAGVPLTVAGSRGQPAPHPLLAQQRAERGLLVRLLDRLQLPADGEWDNLNASQRARKAARARWS